MELVTKKICMNKMIKSKLTSSNAMNQLNGIVEELKEDLKNLKTYKRKVWNLDAIL